MKKNIIYITFSGLLFFSYSYIGVHAYSYRQDETIWDEIFNHYSPALNNPILTDEEIESLIDPEDPYNIDRKKAKRILRRKNKKNDNRKALISLFNSNLLDQKDETSDEDETESENIITQTLWKNLELFCGENDYAANLLSQIDHTISQAGSVMLAKIMVEPTTDISELQRRQVIIKELVENETLYKKLQALIRNYAHIEQDLLTFWEHKVFNKLFSSEFYFPPFPLNKLPDWILDNMMPHQVRNTFNQSPWMLDCLTLFNNMLSLKSIKLDVRRIYKAWTGGPRGEWGTIKSHYNNHLSPNAKNLKNNFCNTFENLFNCEIKQGGYSALKTGGDSLFLLGNLIMLISDIDNIVDDIAHVPLHILSILKTSEDEWKKWKTLRKAHEKLQKAASTIKYMIEMQKLISNNKQLKTHITCTKDIEYLLNETSSTCEEFDKMLDKLKTGAFDKEAKTIILARGKILATSYLMAKTQNKLIDILQAIGQLDVYLSLATLYKQSQKQDATYCFARYIEQEAPYINIKEFWTPFISQDEVVTNNIELGAKGSSRNAIITGPNAGGKSTILKAITINLLFAQTFGICPSKSLVCTPFAYIDTYLNITDDIAGGNSTFKAEVLRVKELITEITEIAPEKCFAIMDEMFKGTNPVEGEAASFAIGRYLAKLDNSIIMVATHYNKMPLLEKETNGIFENFKITVEEGLSYPFKLYKGISNQTIAIDIMEHEKFKPEIIRDARKLIPRYNFCSSKNHSG